MGFNVCCIAIKTKDKKNVLKALNISQTMNKNASAQDVNSRLTIAGQLDNGWFLILDGTFRILEENKDLLEKLSQKYELITCEIGEGWMRSSTVFMKNGKRVWETTYDLNEPSNRFVEKGNLPTTYSKMKKKYLKEHKERFGEYPSNYFSIPTNWFGKNVGYYYDEWAPELPSFEVLELPTKKKATKSSIEKKLRELLPECVDEEKGLEELRKLKNLSKRSWEKQIDKIYKTGILYGKNRRFIGRYFGKPDSVAKMTPAIGTKASLVCYQITKYKTVVLWFEDNFCIGKTISDSSRNPS